MAKHAKNKKRPPQAATELDLPHAVALAIYAHRNGKLDDAETLYTRILAVAPDQPDATHFLGVLRHQRGRDEEAVALIERSITLDPTRADRYNNLGNVLLEMGRKEAAIAAYQKVLELQPEHVGANNNLGVLFTASGRHEEAEAAYLRTIELEPRYADAYVNFGNLLTRVGRVKEAVNHFFKAITLHPEDVQSRKLLGMAYYTTGQIDAAAEVFRKWRDEEPENHTARHMYAACTGVDVPERASDSYVEETFDSFAASFDAKLGRLDYQAPQLVAQAVARALGEPRGDLAGLDAGCGTGLCGPLIRPYLARLVGVDLSARMLERAAGRNCYDELAKGELAAFLAAHPDQYDLIVSADTLVYFGALDGVFGNAARALRPHGRFVFTVEDAGEGPAPEGHRINPHGRYSHRRDYVERVLAAAGFAEISVEAAALRNEGGSQVAGLVVSAARP
jgi:predicted TPR repeat methyltransferase